MSSDSLKKQIIDKVSVMGRKAVARALVDEGLSLHTADKLCGDRYPSEIGSLMAAAIERAWTRLDKAS